MEEKTKMSKSKAFLVPIIIMLVMGIVLFLPAGSLHYWQAGVYWSGFTVLTLFITIYFSSKNPAFLSRRMKYKEKKTTKKPPVFFNLWVLCYIIPGLDFRFHWSFMPDWIAILSNIIVFLGYIFIIRVFMENSYASTIIQVENEQKVISTGPYAIVRHPMYFGLIIMILFTPVALGSYWAIIPALLIIPMNIFRIKSEEALLLNELPGYIEYSKKTKYRLIPYIW